MHVRSLTLWPLVWIAALAISVQAAPATGEVSATARPTAIQERVLELVNRARARGHRCGSDFFPAVAPMVASVPLHLAAGAHARDMARLGYFDHQAPDGSAPKDRARRAGYLPRLTGENIAFGPESAEEVVAGWLDSPGHCANIMDPRFREMGVAVVQGNRRGHFYWVQNLGQPAR
jgi:uncharacterized protein YkwD